MDIGQQIKKLRLQNAYTQKELSQKIGLSPKMISFYENGERIPPIDIVLNLTNIFNVTSDYLLGLDTNLNDREQNMLHTFRQLTIDNQDIIIGEAKKALRDQRDSTTKSKETVK